MEQPPQVAGAPSMRLSHEKKGRTVEVRPWISLPRQRGVLVVLQLVVERQADSAFVGDTSVYRATDAVAVSR